MSFLTDFIKIYESALPPDLCGEIIKRFDGSPTVTTELEHPSQEAHPLRSYQEIVLAKGHQEFLDIQPVMMKVAELAALKYQSEIPVRTFPKEIGCENFRIQKFRAGTGDRHSYHVDVSNYASARRFLGMVWFLNDVEKGAEQYFPHPNIRVKPQSGRMLIYPAMWLYPHTVEPVGETDSYIVSTFLHYI